MPEMSTKDRDMYQSDLALAKAELDAATTIKDLAKAFGREASLRATLNCGVVPNLLYSPICMAFDRLVARLYDLGWQQAVPVDQLGLRLADCAVLADMLHVLHLPLVNDNIPMPQEDHRIARDAARRLESALSALGGAKLDRMREARVAAQEQRSDAFAKDHSQVYIIVHHGESNTQLCVKRAWSYQFDDYNLASRRTFITRASAREYAQELCATFNKTLHEPTRDHAFLD